MATKFREEPMFDVDRDLDDLKSRMCDMGRRAYEKGLVTATDGNLSVRVGEDAVLCTPTTICKGFMTPADLCVVDFAGNQLAGTRKRTSEILLHLTIYRERPDVHAVVHCHPPHATAFALAGRPIPSGVSPEVELFLGEVPTAPYETPGTPAFAETVTPFLDGTCAVVLQSHGTVTFGRDLEQAFWKTEYLEAYCRTLWLAQSLGGAQPLPSEKVSELRDRKKRLGASDP